MKNNNDWDTMGEYFEIYKIYHKERVAKTPARVAYAISQFEKYGIKYELLDGDTGFFHCHRVTDGTLVQFWAGTGKVMKHTSKKQLRSCGRGIRTCLHVCGIKEVSNDGQGSCSDVQS